MSTTLANNGVSDGRAGGKQTAAPERVGKTETQTPAEGRRNGHEAQQKARWEIAAGQGNAPPNAAPSRRGRNSLGGLGAWR